MEDDLKKMNINETEDGSITIKDEPLESDSEDKEKEQECQMEQHGVLQVVIVVIAAAVAAERHPLSTTISAAR